MTKNNVRSKSIQMKAASAASPTYYAPKKEIKKAKLFSKNILFALSIACIAGALFFMLRSNEQKLYTNPPHWYVDFDTSMDLKKHPEKMTPQWGSPVYNIFKKIYEKNNLTKVTYSHEARIPKIIHQIWLGSPVPQEYLWLQKTWKDHHPQWEYRLWTDKEAEDFMAQQSPELQQFYNEAINYGEKSDILKWLIIYTFGGLYTDIPDYECLRPLDMFHHCYDFYTGVQPLGTSLVQLGAALFAAKPGHPILRHCIETLKDDRHLTQIVDKTGPIHFTRSFCAVAPSLTTPVVALPASYFYPRAYDQSFEQRALWLKEESFAVHHWAGSWLKKEGFVPTSRKAT